MKIYKMMIVKYLMLLVLGVCLCSCKPEPSPVPPQDDPQEKPENTDRPQETPDATDTPSPVSLDISFFEELNQGEAEINSHAGLTSRSSIVKMSST